MMIGYLAVICHATNIYLSGSLTGNVKYLSDHPNHMLCRICHILCQELAVRSWISHQLFLVKALGILQGFLGCVSVVTVGLSLQSG